MFTKIPDTAISSTEKLLVESGLFQSWRDPGSGVESFILNSRVAPVQQSFYFVNRSLGDDGRFCWFYCAFPPSGNANQGRSLGVADLAEGTVTHFPETHFTDASPLVDGRTGEVYWCSGLEVWKRSPSEDTRATLVNRFPEKLARNRRPWRLATHLTFSADRKAVNLDVEIGNEWQVGHLPLNGGEFVLWGRFDRCFNHAQFSPVDPDLQLLARDHSVHPVTGEVTRYDNRLWLLRRNSGGVAEPVFADPLAGAIHPGNPHYAHTTAEIVADARTKHGHEWWGMDGRHVFYVHYGKGVFRVNVSGKAERRTPELLWASNTVSHAHASADGALIVADCIPGPHTGIYRVVFINRNTGREAEIVSHSDYPPPALQRYHVHPHPQFCAQDRYVCYTTFVRGRVDVALCDVEKLVAMTS
ncbi:hypothetical protein OPIT5_14700 [Opitutaceae bacterium TAV5]|nr:hypothetical protein OPIT5_14700 [Opitutaceae bacterium TAV5]